MKTTITGIFSIAAVLRAFAFSYVCRNNMYLNEFKKHTTQLA